MFPDGLDPDMDLIKPEDDTDSDISPGEISDPPQPDSATSSQVSPKNYDLFPLRMRRHTLFPEDSDDDTPIKVEDTNDSESLFSLSSVPSSQSSDPIEDLADLPHEIVERPR